MIFKIFCKFYLTFRFSPVGKNSPLIVGKFSIWNCQKVQYLLKLNDLWEFLLYQTDKVTVEEGFPLLFIIIFAEQLKYQKLKKQKYQINKDAHMAKREQVLRNQDIMVTPTVWSPCCISNCPVSVSSNFPSFRCPWLRGRVTHLNSSFPLSAA